jgi:hypothetical protein
MVKKEKKYLSGLLCYNRVAIKQNIITDAQIKRLYNPLGYKLDEDKPYYYEIYKNKCAEGYIAEVYIFTDVLAYERFCICEKKVDNGKRLRWLN